MTNFNDTYDAITKDFMDGKITANEATARFNKIMEAMAAAKEAKSKEAKVKAEKLNNAASNLISATILYFEALTGETLSAEDKLSLAKELLPILNGTEGAKAAKKPSFFDEDIMKDIKTLKNLVNLSAVIPKEPTKGVKPIKSKYSIDKILDDFIDNL